MVAQSPEPGAHDKTGRLVAFAFQGDINFSFPYVEILPQYYISGVMKFNDAIQDNSETKGPLMTL